MQHASVEEQLHHLRNAAGLVQIDSEVFTAGLQVANHRHFFAHALEIVNRPFHVCGMRDGQEVQYGIG